MKFTTSVLSGLALCIVNVAAQDFGSLPTCAQGCATNAIPASCGLDVSCICSASSFITSVSCCVATACDAADQQKTIQFAEQLCAGVGITALPSAAGCSATGAATSASAGTSTAAGGTATSKASAASSAVTSAKTSASAVSSSTATSGKTTTATGTASSSASSTSHSGAATPLAKGNGVAAAGAGAAALLAAIFV